MDEHKAQQAGSQVSPAARAAIERTNSWQPSRARRQSWSKEDHKHALQMTGVEGIRSGHEGFTERK